MTIKPSDLVPSGSRWAQGVTDWLKRLDTASGYVGTDAGNGIILTGTPPAAPVANRLYKHPNAGGHLAVPLTAADADAAIAGALTAAQGGIAAGSLEDWHVVGAANEPAFQNWGSSGTIRFRKLPVGVVVVSIELVLSHATLYGDGNPVFTLPIGYRPYVPVVFMLDEGGSWTASLRIDFETNGAMEIQGASKTVNGQVMFMAAY